MCAYQVGSDLLIVTLSRVPPAFPLSNNLNQPGCPIAYALNIMANSPQELHPAYVAVNKDDLVIPVNSPLRSFVVRSEMPGQ